MARLKKRVDWYRQSFATSTKYGHFSFGYFMQKEMVTAGN